MFISPVYYWPAHISRCETELQLLWSKLFFFFYKSWYRRQLLSLRGHLSNVRVRRLGIWWFSFILLRISVLFVWNFFPVSEMQTLLLWPPAADLPSIGCVLACTWRPNPTTWLQYIRLASRNETMHCASLFGIRHPFAHGSVRVTAVGLLRVAVVMHSNDTLLYTVWPPTVTVYTAVINHCYMRARSSWMLLSRRWTCVSNRWGRFGWNSCANRLSSQICACYRCLAVASGPADHQRRRCNMYLSSDEALLR